VPVSHAGFCGGPVRLAHGAYRVRVLECERASRVAVQLPGNLRLRTRGVLDD
jgi:hypothetical protein